MTTAFVEGQTYGSLVEVNDVAWDEPQGGYSQGRDGLMLSYYPSSGKYWMFGGWAPAIWTNQTTNELWSSPDGYTWTLVQSHLENPAQSGSTARPRRRHGGQMFPHTCQDGTQRLVMICQDIQDGTYWGNQGFPNGYQPDVWTWDGSIWVPKTLSASWGRGTSAVWGTIAFSLPGGGTGSGDTLYVCGGQTTGQAGSAVSHVWKSRDDGATWTQITDAPWAGRSHSFCSQTRGFGNGNVIVMACGGQYDGNAANEVPYDDVWQFDGTTWTALAPHFGGLKRNYTNIIWWAAEQLLVLADGFNGGTNYVGNLNDVWTSPDGYAWSQQFVSPWAVTHADSLVTNSTSTKVYRQGGITINNADQVKVHSLSATLPSKQTLAIEEGPVQYAKIASIGHQTGPAGRTAVLNFADIDPSFFGTIVPLIGSNVSGTPYPLIGFDRAHLWLGDNSQTTTSVILTGYLAYFEGSLIGGYCGPGTNPAWFASGNPCNMGFFSTSITYGGGTGCLGIADAGTVPSSAPSNGLIYSDSTAGAMRTRGKGNVVVGFGSHGNTNALNIAEIDEYATTVALGSVAGGGGTATVSLSIGANEAWSVTAYVDGVATNAEYHRKAQARVTSNGTTARFSSAASGSLANPTNSFAATEVEVVDAAFKSTGGTESTNIFTVSGSSLVLTVTNNGTSANNFLVRLARTRIK